MASMNPFRILGDVSHTLSKCILIWAIHSNKSAEGVSFITQGLYALVFTTRYLDIFGSIYSKWNFVLKIFYISSSLYILFLMLRVYARTREREKAWKLGGACLAGSAVLAPLVMMMFDKSYTWDLQEVLWVFSIILESTCILPQLLLLRQTTVPTVLTSFYLLTLGSYRAFYILNWIWRELDTNDRAPDAISIIFGIVQTALYLDFAYVYWGRQRVKLRNGGVVDEEDFGRGWFLTRILGKRGPRILRGDGSEHGDDVERTSALGNGAGDEQDRRKAASKWGTRGISVSADEGVLDGEASSTPGFGSQVTGTVVGEDGAAMRNPEEMERTLNEDEDDDDEDGLLPATPQDGHGAEWRDGK